MFASALITFRETLEAALVVGILITFLTKTNQDIYKKFVWTGTGIGVLAAVGVAVLLKSVFGTFEGRTEQIFEGILMFTTAGFLTWMILWVHRQKGIVKNLQKQVQTHIKSGYTFGLILLPLTAVLREGVETVFYLQAISQIGASNQWVGATVGVIGAVVLGYTIFRFSVKVDFVKLLKITGAFLLLFAAGLVAHGVHEFQEAGLLPIFSFDPLINITHILDTGGVLGSMLRTLFGYTPTPTLLELLSYGLFIYLIYLLEKMTDQKLQSQFAKAN